MVCVRLVHGRGVVFKPALQRWCAERGIPFEPEPNNPGSALIYPSRRIQVNQPFTNSLKDKGLSLTPDEAFLLHNPEAARKAEADALARRQADERKQQTDAMAQLLAKRRDDAMWREEIDRLNGIEKRRGGKLRSDVKPLGPVIRPPSEIKHQEGWWNAELVRVADTDTETLKVQKRTGLDKLAPPVTAQKPVTTEPVTERRKPTRDTAADQALFDEELARLKGK